MLPLIRTFFSDIYLVKEKSIEKADYQVSYHLKELLDRPHQVPFSYIYFPGYNAHVYFYMNRLNDELGVKTELIAPEAMKPGMLVLCGRQHYQSLQNRISSRIIYSENEVVVIKVLAGLVQ